jgi:hypothetical protein
MANEVNIKITADDMASSKIGGLNNKLKSMRGTFLGVTAAGGAVTGILGMMTKSSLDQEIGINRLDNALQNANSSYVEQQHNIENVISALQAKTNFGDEEQRDSLTKLIGLTGNHTLSLQALGVAADLAAAQNMSLDNASLLLGKVLAGNTSALSRYGIQLKEGASNTEILDALTNQFGGSAEASVDPMVQLKNRVGDFAQVIGDVLLPIINEWLPKLEKIVFNIIEFAEENPKLVKTLVLGGAALGAIAVALGTLGLALPPIIGGFIALKTAGIGLTAVMAANPLGIIIVAITTLSVILIPKLIKNFDKIKEVFANVIDSISPMIEHFVNNFTGMINLVIKGLNVFLRLVKKEIPEIPKLDIPTMSQRSFSNQPSMNLFGSTQMQNTDSFGGDINLTINTDQIIAENVAETVAQGLQTAQQTGMIGST